MYSVTSLLLTLAAVGHAAVHESLSALPYGWSKFDQTVPSSAQIKLHVSLAYQNLGQLESRLAAVSTPGSPDYGKYIDLAAQQAIFAPANECASQVIAWLQQAGAQDVSWDGHAVSFVSTVQQANSLLEAEFSLYSNGDTVKLRTTRYSIPDDLTGAIDLISPTTYFGSTTAQGVARARTSASKTQDAPPTKRRFSSSCETVIVVSKNRTYDVLSPLCLKELYNIGNYSVDKSAGSSIAFGSFLNQSASYSDLAVFERMSNIPSQNFSVLALINGGVDNQNSTTEQDGEANLDVQNIIGLVDGLPVGEYITGGLPPFIPDLLTPNKSTEQNEPYLPYYQYLLSQPNSNLPHVITNSYGDHENTVPERYAKRVCNLIGIMGLRGRTILESAGDEGVGAVCLDNRNGKPQFSPQFPGTCPYITAVGGTQFTTPEYAWNASSGGFSNYFPTAFYQKQAVQTYLDDHIRPATKAYYANNGYANFSGRGFPDISAHSLYPDYLTVIDGMPEPNGGTSAASPVVASIFALLNDARFRAGQPALGFANPLLYALNARNSSGVNDIIYGGSLGCSGVDLQNGEVLQGAGIIPYASWNATIGWDPVTGLGTPNFQNLRDAALAAW